MVIVDLKLFLFHSLPQHVKTNRFSQLAAQKKMPFPFTGIMIPTDNDTTAGSEHPWVSDRERVKVLSTVIQQMLVVLGATFVVQTK
jgi:hypothetical protein